MTIIPRAALMGCIVAALRLAPAHAADFPNTCAAVDSVYLDPPRSFTRLHDKRISGTQWSAKRGLAGAKCEMTKEGSADRQYRRFDCSWKLPTRDATKRKAETVASELSRCLEDRDDRRLQWTEELPEPGDKFLKLYSARGNGFVDFARVQFQDRPGSVEARLSLSYREKQMQEERLTLPVKGAWWVVQGPPCPRLGNSHCSYPSNIYALDLVPANGSCQDQPIFAPTSGEVVEVEDGHPNYPMPGVPDAGNHVVIKADGGYIVLAHFSPETITVGNGDKVRVGQPLGKCGNSGNSRGAHLHIHMQATPDISAYFERQAIEMTFSNVRVRSLGGRCESKSNYSLRHGDRTC
jgi:hypothetical protein